MSTPEAEATGNSICLLPDCGLVIPPAKRGGVRKFCSDRHRAAYRDLLIQLAVRDALDIVVETKDELARLSARLTGALAHLEKLQTSHRKKSAERTTKDLTAPATGA